LRELKPDARRTGWIDVGRPIPAWTLGHAVFAPQCGACARQVAGNGQEDIDAPGHMMDQRADLNKKIRFRVGLHKWRLTGCEFSVAQELLVLATGEGNHVTGCEFSVAQEGLDHGVGDPSTSWPSWNHRAH